MDNYHSRKFAIADAVKDLKMCDYPNYRLAIEILSGETGRSIKLNRTFLERIRDAYQEFMAKERFIPPRAP